MLTEFTEWVKAKLQELSTDWILEEESTGTFITRLQFADVLYNSADSILRSIKVNFLAVSTVNLQCLLSRPK